MKRSKWIWVPVMACALLVINGCGSAGETKVIEVTADQEQAALDADAAYDEQYQDASENYE